MWYKIHLAWWLLPGFVTSVRQAWGNMNFAQFEFIHAPQEPELCALLLWTVRLKSTRSNRVFIIYQSNPFKSQSSNQRWQSIWKQWNRSVRFPKDMLLFHCTSFLFAECGFDGSIKTSSASQRAGNYFALLFTLVFTSLL